MNEESHHEGTFIQTWARRTLTISGCIIIWLFLLIAFPALLIVATVIDVARRGNWIITRCVFFFSFYFSLAKQNAS